MEIKILKLVKIYGYKGLESIFCVLVLQSEYKMIYTTNWIEGFKKSYRRTIKVRGAFPSEESLLALLSSFAKDKSDKKYKYPIYLFQYEEKLRFKIEW